MPLDAVAAVEGVAEGGKGGGEVVYPHFSKVDVVEMAIGYIRRLQRENEEMVRRVKAGEGSPDGGGGGGWGREVGCGVCFWRFGGGGWWVEDDTNDSWMSLNWNSIFTALSWFSLLRCLKVVVSTLSPRPSER